MLYDSHFMDMYTLQRNIPLRKLVLYLELSTFPSLLQPAEGVLMNSPPASTLPSLLHPPEGVLVPSCDQKTSVLSAFDFGNKV